MLYVTAFFAHIVIYNYYQLCVSRYMWLFIHVHEAEYLFVYAVVGKVTVIKLLRYVTSYFFK